MSVCQGLLSVFSPPPPATEAAAFDFFLGGDATNDHSLPCDGGEVGEGEGVTKLLDSGFPSLAPAPPPPRCGVDAEEPDFPFLRTFTSTSETPLLLAKEAAATTNLPTGWSWSF